MASLLWLKKFKSSLVIHTNMTVTCFKWFGYWTKLYESLACEQKLSVVSYIWDLEFHPHGSHQSDIEIRFSPVT